MKTGLEKQLENQKYILKLINSVLSTVKKKGHIEFECPLYLT